MLVGVPPGTAVTVIEVVGVRVGDVTVTMPVGVRVGDVTVTMPVGVRVGDVTVTTPVGVRVGVVTVTVPVGVRVGVLIPLTGVCVGVVAVVIGVLVRVGVGVATPYVAWPNAAPARPSRTPKQMSPQKMRDLLIPLLLSLRKRLPETAEPRDIEDRTAGSRPHKDPMNPLFKTAAMMERVSR